MMMMMMDNGGWIMADGRRITDDETRMMDDG